MSSSPSSNIEVALTYGMSLVGQARYKWWHPDMRMIGDVGPFWAYDAPVPDVVEIATCTGLLNLMRRKVGLRVPGVQERSAYAGGTYEWFTYLDSRDLLLPFDTTRRYPKGTLLLSPYVDEANQGHVAVLISEGASSVLDEKLLHSYSEELYDPNQRGIVMPGICMKDSVADSHFWKPEGYYTHACLPENWLI